MKKYEIGTDWMYYQNGENLDDLDKKTFKIKKNRHLKPILLPILVCVEKLFQRAISFKE